MKSALQKMRAYKPLSSFFDSPLKLAILLAILLLVWLVLIGEHKRAKTDEPESTAVATNTVSAVQVRNSVAEPWSQIVVAQGQILPWRRVSLNAEVEGHVLELNKNQGDTVKAGDVLLKLSDEGRAAQLKQAKANLEYAKLELEGAKSLKTSNFTSETELSGLKSALASAEAQLELAQLAYDYGKPKAPFDGIVDRRHIEIGDQVNKDTPLFDVVQIDKLRVTAYIPQQRISLLTLGQNVSLSLLNGQSFEGQLIFISAAADEATRSYYIEVAVDNPERLRIAGASATINLPTEPVMSHSVSPALLSLDQNGKPGLFTVSNDNKVEYFQVELLSIGKQAVVAGLPDTTRIITVGAGFVKEGQAVQASEPAI